MFILLCAALKIFAQQNVDSLLIEWRFKTGSPIIASPVIQNDLVLFGSTDSIFYALNASAGTVKFTFKTGGDIRSTCVVLNDRIWLNGGDGNLYCLNLQGELVWTFKTNGEKKYPLYSFADYFQSSPVYDTGDIFFGSGDSCIYAVNASTRKMKWKFKTDDIVHSTAAVSGNNIFIGSFDGYFYSLNRNTGKLNWKFKSIGQQYFPKGEFNGSATVIGNTVYVGSRDYNFYALDTAKGFAKWNLRFPRGWAITTPVTDSSVLYIGTSDDRSFIAADLAGNIFWRFDAKYNMFGAPIVHDNTIFFGTMMGNLFGLNKKTGTVQYKFMTDASRLNRKNYFKEDESYRDDIFKNIIKKNEDFLQLYIETGGIISQPAISRNRIFVTSMDGTLYCLKLKD